MKLETIMRTGIEKLTALSAAAHEAVTQDAAASSGITETGQSAAKPKKAAPEIEKVTMEDGRTVEFVGKRRMLKESVFNDTGYLASVRFDFRNGRVVNYTPDRNLKTSDGKLLIEMFIGHGIEQKLGDEAANPVDKDGNPVDIDDVVLDIESLIERLSKDPVEWSMRRTGDGMAGTSILLKALAELNPSKGIEGAKAFLKDKTHADKLALRNSPKLKPIVERLEAEKAAKGSKIDATALLEGFESAEPQAA